VTVHLSFPKNDAGDGAFFEGKRYLLPDEAMALKKMQAFIDSTV
jgi:hypothetical protein